MKLTIERAALLRKSLGHVQNVVERRTTIPILPNVKLAGRDGPARPDRDRHGPVGGARAGRGRAKGHHHRRRAHPLRHRAQAADGSEVGIEQNGGGRARSRCGPRARCSTCPRCRRRFSGDRRGAVALRFQRPRATSPADRPDPVRDLDRGDRYYLNGIYLHATNTAASMCCAASRPTVTASRGWRCRCRRARA